MVIYSPITPSPKLTWTKCLKPLTFHNGVSYIAYFDVIVILPTYKLLTKAVYRSKYDRNIHIKVIKTFNYPTKSQPHATADGIYDLRQLIFPFFFTPSTVKSTKWP